MRFWDSSALVPLLFAEPRSREARRLLREDPEMALWWSSPVECASALWRRLRAGDVDRTSFDRAFAALASFRSEAETVLPEDSVRERALQVLAVHALGAADALQLAAALVHRPPGTQSTGFVCFDRRLRAAAHREGFSIFPRDTSAGIEPFPEDGGRVVTEVAASYGRVRRHALTKIRKR
ncbi:MAG: type II toxin-antitoxin system VapC family toxin [Planctomycetes bacterium]|nr:type II toxin-antitoxin system VapC family toxin [Planctomycetota bacterium]